MCRTTIIDRVCRVAVLIWAVAFWAGMPNPVEAERSGGCHDGAVEAQAGDGLRPAPLQAQPRTCSMDHTGIPAHCTGPITPPAISSLFEVGSDEGWARPDGDRDRIVAYPNTPPKHLLYSVLLN